MKWIGSGKEQHSERFPGQGRINWFIVTEMSGKWALRTCSEKMNSKGQVRSASSYQEPDVFRTQEQAKLAAEMIREQIEQGTMEVM